MEKNLRQKSINSFFWKTSQSVCTLGTTFIIQLVLARRLDPVDFGLVAITSVFLTLANTVIETSFASSIIQQKEITKKTLSSIFYANLILSVLIYFLLFFGAPLLSTFYKEELLTSILRVQGLNVIFSAFSTVQDAQLNRQMRFKTLFFCHFIGTIFQALVGFGMVCLGYGVWSLVISTLVGYLVAGLCKIVVCRWVPSFYFSLKLIKRALSFSSKILAIRFFRKLFYNIRTLAIGKFYDTTTLGYFNKGFQFPSTAMTVIDGSLTSVAFTSLAKLQDDSDRFLIALRHYVQIMMYICMPVMIGMVLIAKPMILVILTEKWLPAIPFLQIVCFTQLLIPLNVKTTAFEALGNSGLSMKLHVSSVVLSVSLLFASCFFSVYVMVFSGFVSSLILQIAITICSKKHLKYNYLSQLKDMFSGFIPTVFMSLIVVGIQFLQISNMIKLVLSIFLGIFIYILVSIITKNSSFYYIFNILKKIIKKGRVNE